jgi:myo-inositol-1-phosphate synthase
MAPHAETDSGTANGGGHSNNGVASNGSAARPKFIVNSPNVVYSDTEIRSKYTYRTTMVTDGEDGTRTVTPKETVYDFKLNTKIPKVGVMLVGLGGNNGTTITAGIIANRRGLVWETRNGPQTANYYGSVVMGSTLKLGTDTKTGQDVNIPFHDVLPMVHPNDLVIGGWDISGMNLADAMDRAKVLEPTLKALVRKEMAAIVPLPSIYYPDFIAANQEDRADNLIAGSKACMAHVEQIRKDIRYVTNARVYGVPISNPPQ